VERRPDLGALEVEQEPTDVEAAHRERELEAVTAMTVAVMFQAAPKLIRIGGVTGEPAQRVGDGEEHDDRRGHGDPSGGLAAAGHGRCPSGLPSLLAVSTIQLR
jgi:hypothetical protein